MTYQQSCSTQTINGIRLSNFVAVTNLVWFLNWVQIFHSKHAKTKLIVFGSRAMTAKVEDFCLTLLGKELLPVNSVKDLGVLLDSNMTFNDNLASTISICMSRLGQINRVKHAFDRNTLTIVINALVLSKLYCWYVLSKLYCC